MKIIVQCEVNKNHEGLITWIDFEKGIVKNFSVTRL